MAADGSGEDELLAFLYACPVGLIQCDGAGLIEIINPYAMQHLLTLAQDGDTTNLFQALAPYAPELRTLVEGAAPTVGCRICEGYRINVELARGRAARGAQGGCPPHGGHGAPPRCSPRPSCASVPTG